LSAIGFFSLVGTAVYLLRRAKEANEVKKSYENRQISLSQFASQQLLTESQSHIKKNVY
jgi:hypothetical protein